MSVLLKVLIRSSLFLFIYVTFLYAFPAVGDTPQDFTRYHYQLEKVWNLYEHMDGNTVILLMTGSFT